MELNTSNWRYFEFDKIFTIKKGFYNKKPEFTDGGDIPFIGATDKNHGITGTFSKEEIEVSTKTGKAPNSPIDKKIFPPNAVCVTNNGSVGYAYYMERPFTCSHDVNPLYRKNGEFSAYTGLFISTVIMNERYRWGYGRKWRPIRMKHSLIKLPIVMNQQNPVIDKEKIYSSKGFIPDWEYMEKYIKSLNHIVPETKNNTTNIKLDTDTWKPFLLKNLFYARMGNKIDAVMTTHNNPKYNYVSRNSNNNGVVDCIDEVEGEKPFKSGDLTLALGGSFLGSCFVQDKPFYTAQNVAVLSPKSDIDVYSKLFISAIIKKEAATKFQAFGRELNSHYKSDFDIKLPIMRKSNGKPVVDNSNQFSSQGFIPDWQFMKQYIKSLPNGDLI